MKKSLIVAAIGLTVGSAMAGASLSVDFGSSHVFRGATVVEDFVIQPAMELSGFGLPEKYGVLAAGVWGSTAPFNDDTPTSFDSIYETDWYIRYTLSPLAERLDLYIQYTQYQYSTSADEKELNLGVGYELGGFNLGGSANFMIDDRNALTEDQRYVDLFGNYVLEINEKSDVTLGALVALMFQGDGNSARGRDDGFNHYELDAVYSYTMSELWSLGASLRYIGQLDSNVLPDTAYDKGLIAFFSLSCDM